MFIDILSVLTKVFIFMGIIFLVAALIYFFRKDVRTVFGDMQVMEQGSNYDNSAMSRQVFDSLSGRDIESARRGDTGRVSILGNIKEEDTEALGSRKNSGERVTAENSEIACSEKKKQCRKEPEERTEFLSDSDEKTELLKSEFSADDERTELLGGSACEDDERTALLRDSYEEKTEYLSENSEEKTAYLGGEGDPGERTEYLANFWNSDTDYTEYLDDSQEDGETEYL